jgi:hypothetical protein
MSDFKLLIDGKMVPGDLTMPVLNPATEEAMPVARDLCRARVSATVCSSRVSTPALPISVTWKARCSPAVRPLPPRSGQPGDNDQPGGPASGMTRL